jgi:hypothetical protein
MNKEIRVNYMLGLKRSDFLELENLGFETDIPEEKANRPLNAIALEPDVYLTIFTFYFSIKFTEELAKELAKGLATTLIKKFPKTIKGIWDKHKDLKPAIVTTKNGAEYKLPRAILSFKISENESTTLKITGDINESDLESLLKSQLEFVKIKDEAKKKK